MSGTPYFSRTAPMTFTPSQLVQGTWNLEHQHPASALGVLVHLAQSYHARRASDDGRGAPLLVSRLCFDILGTLPLEACEAEVHLVRPGRTIELVEASLSHDGRSAIVLRAWFLDRRDTGAVAGSALSPIAGPEELPVWRFDSTWKGSYLTTIEARRKELEPGHVHAWVRTDIPLLDEPVSDLARYAGLLDLGNGVGLRALPEDVTYPNVELTASFFRQPTGPWTGFDTTVSFGPDGQGLTSTVLQDEHGPIGTMSQVLTVRPRH